MTSATNDSAAPAKPDSAAARTERRQRRSMQTRLSVIWGEKIAASMITVGGLLVIVAVLGIMVFLFQVAVPLLGGGAPGGSVSYQLEFNEKVEWVNADEFQTIGTVVGAGGEVLNFHVPTGRLIARQKFDLEGRRITAAGGTLERDRILLGFDDGSVRFGRLGIHAATTKRDQLPPGATQLDARDRLFEGRVYTQVQTGDYRTLAPANELGASEKISDAAIIALDYRVGGTVERPTVSFATVDARGEARVSQSRIQRNMLTGEETVHTLTVELPPTGAAPNVKVTSVLISGTADRVILATDDGTIYRYDLREFERPVLAERRRVLPDDVAVSAMTLLGGEQSLVVGGSDGSISVFFRLQREGADTGDGFELVRARTHAAMPAAVTDISEAQRDKSFVVTDALGNVRVIHSTSDQVLFDFKRTGDVTVPSMAMIFPRSDGVLLVSERGAVNAWQYSDPHPEITWRVLFGKVWYEGYDGPGYTWQSTAGTDLAEPKYSLIPLIFGTVKAAFYALLFGAPIALWAAIYTSEFVHPAVRSTVKPMMEMMESLPTVVLGFVAALVLAPFVEEWIGAVLLAFIALPMGLMLGAFVWQMLPVRLVLRYDGIPKFCLMGASIFVTAYLAYQLGPWFEGAFFYGDFKAWTTGETGTGTPFMFLITLPLSYMAVAYAFRRYAGHHYRAFLAGRSRTEAGGMDMLRWATFLAAAMILSFTVASLLTAIGYDPRGGIIDTYQQRNALVVGFVMAFAVVPNIYTLAEDALNSVPGHLRAGSLACGATPWQTATFIVLPTAASGVFSAVMMGMGRAVGETMIVVMAAGNTPVMEWNVFSGLRTLSANIAIELPEAVKDGTNYRVLFLAALTLFIMTFVINTFAELIRQRFRRRAFAL
jgi:phosphate transport system permease protein